MPRPDAPEWTKSEAALVAEFLQQLAHNYQRRVCPWVVYPETAKWDLLLVHREDGRQIGIEAKLSLNAKVIAQALKGQHPDEWSKLDGPDYRAVLVPSIGRQAHLREICDAIGVAVITLHDREGGRIFYHMDLPDREDRYSLRHWHNWCPSARCPLPDYIPDVAAGHKSPVKLTEWKVKAIKLLICLERQGWVDRAMMRALNISASRWTDRYHGYLAPDGQGRYVRCDDTPDLRAQHPENYVQIEADRERWGCELDAFKQSAPDWLK